ncbi:MAG: hypothetical protein ABR992_06170 [Solirubrobacteraceae bacterium]
MAGTSLADLRLFVPAVERERPQCGVDFAGSGSNRTAGQAAIRPEQMGQSSGAVGRYAGR